MSETCFGAERKLNIRQLILNRTGSVENAGGRDLLYRHAKVFGGAICSGLLTAQTSLLENDLTTTNSFERKLTGLLLLALCGAAGPGSRTAKKKDVRDYNDADMARLLEQWEKDDDIEEGDLPEHRRPPAPVDFSKIDPGKPESILKLTKKGKTLMMFVTVSGNPTEKETEELTSLWQGSLFNANYDVQRFIVGANRAIFMLRDGSYAWEIKDFLVNQERCADVTLEGQVYPGKGAEESEKVKNKTKPEKTKKKKDAEKKSKPLEDNQASKEREEL
ncbi:PREDICTED: LDLR chaperone MESD [Gavialis gangeticus]|uniref:LDLR chaperone MESD n=1 Tax=Gavialis gangeticus TaxID=94835 RepID=UPI00092E5B65|nr:PREDICTED: LDLR chaperone MESD [Gavialis gangeticus]